MIKKVILNSTKNTNHLAFVIKCFKDKVYPPKKVSYIGKDAAQKFVEMLEEDIKIINNIPKRYMIFKDEEREQYEKETRCWICKGELNDDDKNKKVRDHCHFTGRYRGAAHNKCNLDYKKPNFTPVVFHNLSGYDSHLSIKILVLVRVISNVSQTMKKSILALVKVYRLGVI